MEEVAKTAEAYYERLTPAQKQRAIDIFRSMDVNGDRAITFNEYSRYCRAQGHREPTLGFFNLFDKNRDGALDFNEFLSLHYLALTGRMFTCDGCHDFLTRVYFTCSICFHTPRTYDLCRTCFRHNRYVHPHSADAFLDNHALLILNRQQVLNIQRQNQAIVHHHHYPQHQNPGNSTVGIGELLQAFVVGYQATSLCNIM